MRIYLSLLLLLCFGISACKTKAIVSPADELPPGLVHFVNSPTLGKVLDQAERENKIVFVDFYTDWCITCKLMDEDVFTDKMMADFLNDNFINYKINAEKANGPDLSVLYQVQSYPTLLFLDERGRVIVRKDGAAYHTELKRLGTEALNYKDVGCVN